MQLLRRLLCIVALAVPLSAHAAVVVVSGGGAPGIWLALMVWLGFQERPVVPVSPHHLSAPAPRAADSCTFVAGVQHCPLPKLSEPK
jgi:hypothetical protein